MKILVTGSAGMIGGQLVDALLNAGYEVVGVDRNARNDKWTKSLVVDLSDKEQICSIVRDYNIDRIIHLAALAHTANEDDLSYERYYHINVECAKNVFEAAGSIPVLFISTVDVYGFTKERVNASTLLKPVTPYGKTKALAEKKLKEICPNWSIFRFSPVYTPEIKRDIQKRYYLKYPNIAYYIGKGGEFEVLDIHKAVNEMVAWCEQKPDNSIRIIKDEKLLNVLDCIQDEKKFGRAKYVLYFPKFIIRGGLYVLKLLTGENKYTYLLNKAVNPMRTE